MSSELKNKTVKGLGWSSIDSFASQGISFIVGIILARLLSPEEFGVIGIATILTVLFDKIVDCGFSNALIRKQDVKDIDFNTTFYFNLVLSCILYLVCFVCAPLIAAFFHNEALIKVVRWISLSLIISAFAIIQRTRLVKKIDFKTQAKISLTASILSGGVGITMAFLGCGVWSLVGQHLSRQISVTVLLWIFNKWAPRLEFSFTSFKQLFSYGGKLMLSGIIDTLCSELTVIFVGRIYTSATLGQYSRAKQFIGIFSSNLSSIIERVTYPVLSRIQENKTQLIANYRKIIRVLMLVTGIGTAIMASCAKSIILILIGPKWVEAILYMQLYAFVVITVPLKNFNLNLLQVYGRSDYILVLSIIKRVIEVGAVFLGFIGMKWMLIGFAIAGVIGFLLNAYCTMKVSGYSLSRQIGDLIPSLVACSIIGLIMYAMSFIITNIYLCLLLQLMVGATLFFAIYEKTKFEEYLYIKDIVKEYIVRPIQQVLAKNKHKSI